MFVMLLVCSMAAQAQQFKVMKGDILVKSWTINQVDSIAIEQIDEGIEVFKLMMAGKTVATYNRLQADRIEICKGIMVTYISGVPQTLSIEKGKILKLDASVNEDASDKTLTWSSSDESILLVSREGHIAALKAGNATITVKANDGSGVSVICKVTVTLPAPE